MRWLGIDLGFFFPSRYQTLVYIWFSANKMAVRRGLHEKQTQETLLQSLQTSMGASPSSGPPDALIAAFIALEEILYALSSTVDS